MKKLLSLLLVCLMSISLAACSSDTTTADASASASATTESTSKLVIYSPNSEALIQATIPLFEQKYGIDVDVISAGSGECLKRIESEKNDPQGDVMFGGSYATDLAYADLFEPYVSSNDANLIEEYRNTDGFITKYILDGSVIVVNNKLLEKALGADVKINGYQDLIDNADKLEGQIIAANPSVSSSGYAQLTNMLQDFGGYDSDEAWQKVTDLYSKTLVVDSSSAVWKGVRDAEYTVGLSYEDPCATLVKEGADVSIVYMDEGVVYLPAASVIIKGCKNEENAKLFMDFITSEEVQNIYGETLTNRPVYKDASVADYMTPFSDIKLTTEDTQYVTDNKQALVDRFLDIVIQ